MITHPDREHGTAFKFDMHFGDSTVDNVAVTNKEIHAMIPSGVEDFFKGFNISTLVSGTATAPCQHSWGGWREGVKRK